MIDIAIATVADLYEDNGGIPASLQFPKLDDVKADVNKVSAGGLRPGQAVIINSSTLNQASALPGFAVPDMKKTFGLTGVVKNVDKVCYLLSRLSFAQRVRRFVASFFLFVGIQYLGTSAQLTEMPWMTYFISDKISSILFKYFAFLCRHSAHLLVPNYHQAKCSVILIISGRCSADGRQFAIFFSITRVQPQYIRFVITHLLL